MKFRIEKDPLGKKKVPKNAFYGIHTQRAKENFQVCGNILPLELFYAIAEIKIAAASANKELKLLSLKKANSIVRAAKEILRGNHDSEFVIDAFQAGAGTPTHMNVNEVIANIGIQFLKGKRGDYSILHPNDDVNMGQSTNNVFPTALKIVTLKKLEVLIENLIGLRNSLMKKSGKFRKVLKSGRTHLQDAVPITLGKEFHAYATSIDRNIKNLKYVKEKLKEINVGKNAIGTGINAPSDFTKRIIKHLKKINRVEWREAKDPVFSTQNITVFLEVAENLNLLSVDLNKIANDLRLLNSGPNTGLNEIRIPEVEPGSSIMPGKVNPSIAEMMNMICFQVMGNSEAIRVAGDAGQLELNAMTPLIARNLIESINILSRGVETFNKKCIVGIKANKEMCKYYLEHSAGLATLLNTKIGYDKATEVTKKSLETGESVKNIILEEGLMSEKELGKAIKSLFE